MMGRQLALWIPAALTVLALNLAGDRPEQHLWYIGYSGVLVSSFILFMQSAGAFSAKRAYNRGVAEAQAINARKYAQIALVEDPFEREKAYARFLPNNNNFKSRMHMLALAEALTSKCKTQEKELKRLKKPRLGSPL
jgi:hypothetical protein